MGLQRSPELGRVSETPAYRRQHQTQTSTHHQTDPAHPQQYYPQAQHPRSGPAGGQETGGYPGYLSMASGPTSRAAQQKPQEVETEESEGAKTEGLLRSKKAVLPSEIRRRERSTEDPWRGRLEEEPGMARVLSLSKARELEAEDPTRGGHRGRARLDELEPTPRLQASESRPGERDSAIYMHKTSAATHMQTRALRSGPGNSSAEAGDPRAPSQRYLQHQAHNPREVRDGKGFTTQETQQDSRVSVARLRHSYMESATSPPAGRRNDP